MLEFEDPHVGSIEALDAGWKDAVAHNTGCRVKRVMMLFVENAAAGGKLLLRLPVVGAELEDEALSWWVGHGKKRSLGIVAPSV